MTYREIRTYISQQLISRYESREATDISLWLLETVLQTTRAHIIAYPHHTITDDHKRDIDRMLSAHLNDHQPLQYLLGTVPFLSLNLDIKPPILIPRPETEAWCAQLIQELLPLKHHPLEILDLCSGSGCIGLSLAQAFPQAHVTLVDINPEAINLGEHNKTKHSLLNVTSIHSDLFNALPGQTYDLIVTNPPYITSDEWKDLEPHIRSWESTIALVAEDNGLATIKRIIDQAPRHLKSDSPAKEILGHQLSIEIGSSQAAAVISYCSQSGIHAESIKDYAGNDRLIRCL